MTTTKTAILKHIAALSELAQSILSDATAKSPGAFAEMSEAVKKGNELTLATSMNPRELTITIQVTTPAGESLGDPLTCRLRQ